MKSTPRTGAAARAKPPRGMSPRGRSAGGRRQATPRNDPPSPAVAGALRQTRCAVLGVTISHPDKPLWSDAGGSPLTKRDLAEYFQAVGSWMMPHLAGRPCSLVRAPDGIEGQHFFQRHLQAGRASPFSSVKVTGDPRPYLEIDRIEQLIAAAQMAVVELHPWNSAPNRPEHPGRLVFDLDPAPDLAFEAVIDAALELRERLKEVGLMAFCKTTGGKGLHVVTPLAPAGGPDWAAAKSFAHAICARMAADRPDRYLVNMKKNLRSGRIFLDYLHNQAFASAVAPLSPRARPGAPVSMPLEWTQVHRRLDPARFTVRTVPQLLARSSAWPDYADAALPLEPAMQRLASTAQNDTSYRGSKRRARR